MYKEHTNTLGSSLAAQKNALDKMLKQCEDSLTHDGVSSPNEVHIIGDINPDHAVMLIQDS